MATRKPTDKQLYKLKNMVLQECCSQVSPFEFYRDVFPEGSLGVRGAPEIQRPNMIFTMIEKDEHGAPHAFNWLVFDDLKDIFDCSFSIFFNLIINDFNNSTNYFF